MNFRRGYTSSRMGFGATLASILADQTSTTNSGDTDGGEMKEKSTSSRFSNFRMVDSHEKQQHWKVNGDALMDTSTLWLSELPLTVDIVVESGHGSKILPNGDIRIDSRASLATLWRLLEESTALDALKNAAISRLKQRTIDEKVKTVSKRLGLVSLAPAVGVTDDQYFHFLQRLTNHLDGTNAARGLLNLRGVRSQSWSLRSH